MNRQRTSSPWRTFAIIVVVIAIIAAFGYAWWSRGNRVPGVNGKESSTTYTVGLLDEPTSIDIRTNSDQATQRALIGNVYQTLVTMNDADEIEGVLAQSWSQTQDGLRYTFQLRQGLTFADGTPLNADAIVQSFQQMMNIAGSAVHQLDYLTQIANEGNNIVITLSQPNPRLLEQLSGPAGVIVNPRNGNGDFATQSYGTGPFTVSNVSQGSITLARNEHYWGTKPYAAGVTLKYFTNESAMMQALSSGSIDVALPTNVSATQDIRNNHDFQVSDGISTRKTLVAFNSASDSPFSDQQVRQLTRYAINAADIARTQPNAQSQLSGPISPLLPGYVDLNSEFPFDVDKAKSMYGYFMANYFEPFTMLTDEAHQALGEQVVKQISAAGLPISLEVVDHATLSTRVNNGEYVCALIDMDNPTDYTKFVDGSAMFGYQNGQVQEQYNTALAQTDFAQYKAQLQMFDKLVSQDAASAWLYTNKDVIAAKKNIQGLPKNLTDWRLPLDQLHE